MKKFLTRTLVGSCFAAVTWSTTVNLGVQWAVVWLGAIAGILYQVITEKE